MTDATTLLFWTAAFAATHMGLSSLRVRPALVAGIGEKAYLAIYSLVSFATFVPLVRAYLAGIHGGPLLWNFRGSPLVVGIAAFVSWASFSFALAAVAQPSPASIGPSQSTRAYGLTRITRHPMFLHFGIWGLAHAVLNGFLNDVVFFGGIFVVGLAGCIHQDARKRITEKGRLDEFFAETSLVPFAAIVAGRQRLVLSEIPWAVVFVTSLVSAAVFAAHGVLFRPA